MVGGLADMVLFCDSKLAADSLARITTWAEKNLDRSNIYAFGGTEWYTRSENLYRAHVATRDPRYADFARVWHYDEYWNRYARHGDLFGDRGNGRWTGAYHAYSHVNTLGGAAQAYLHSGEPWYLDVFRNAHDYRVPQQCYPTGGFGPDEQIIPRREWLRKVETTHNSFETQCGGFAAFKLCRDLMTITDDARYGDWIERLAYNGIAATIPRSPDVHVFDDSDYDAFGALKQNHPVGWTCCTGTRPMALADLHDLVYFRGDDTLYVNLEVPSTVTWRQVGDPAAVVVCQVTRFPEQDSTELIVEPAGTPATFAPKLRVPGWLAGLLEAKVNGERVEAPADPHGWATVRREWKRRDRLTVRLPMRFELMRPDPAAPAPAMLVRGPVTMAVRATGGNLNEILDKSDLERALIPSPGESFNFRPGTGADLLIRPFYALRAGEPDAIEPGPNRHGHREATFRGEAWRDSESFRFKDRPGAPVEFRFHGAAVRWIGLRFDDGGSPRSASTAVLS